MTGQTYFHIMSIHSPYSILFSDDFFLQEHKIVDQHTIYRVRAIRKCHYAPSRSPHLVSPLHFRVSLYPLTSSPYISVNIDSSLFDITCDGMMDSERQTSKRMTFFYACAVRKQTLSHGVGGGRTINCMCVPCRQHIAHNGVYLFLHIDRQIAAAAAAASVST